MTYAAERVRADSTTARSGGRVELPDLEGTGLGHKYVAVDTRRGSLRFWMVGSGGTSPWRDFYPDVGTGGAGVLTYFVWGQNWPAATENPLHTPADKLAFIRSTLSFNISQLASALGVERPTIYSWIANRSEPHPGNLARLDTICGIAARWARLSNMPLATTLRQRGERTDIILGLLDKSAIDEGPVIAKLEEIAGGPRGRRLGVRAAALKRGANLEGVTQRDDELEALTGRRGSPE